MLTLGNISQINGKALTRKILVFWIGGRLWVVVACEGGVAMDEVRLYLIGNLHW